MVNNIIEVEGISWNLCKANVEKSLDSLDFIKTVEIGLARVRDLMSRRFFINIVIEQIKVSLGYVYKEKVQVDYL